MNSCDIHDSYSYDVGGAIGLYGKTAVLSLCNSYIHDNAAQNSGGGLWVDGFASAHIKSSNFDQNLAIDVKKWSSSHTASLSQPFVRGYIMETSLLLKSALQTHDISHFGSFFARITVETLM